MRLFLVLTLVAAALAKEAESSSGWLNDVALQKSAVDVQPHKLPRYSVDLDAPAEERWQHVAKDFVDEVPAVQNYLDSFVPKWALPIIEAIGRDIEPYFGEFGTEMKGIAAAMGMDLGEIVIVNLIYQIESVGLNCSNWNNTGPTHKDDPGCIDVDPDQSWCYCKDAIDEIDNETGLVAPPKSFSPNTGPGLCTSIVTRNTKGDIYHGRNLDWNLDASLLKLAVDVDFQRKNKTVFSGTTLVGFVGVLSGMTSTFSGSIDARDKGGLLWQNLAEALLHSSTTPAQHLRTVLETATSFTAAAVDLSAKDLINEIYYIIGGRTSNEGAIISRGRTPSENGPIKTLNDTNWFVAQTNYDWWNPVPTADDRRTPLLANLKTLGVDGINATSVHDIMTKWPTFNHHTDYTGVFQAATGLYSSETWY